MPCLSASGRKLLSSRLCSIAQRCHPTGVNLKADLYARDEILQALIYWATNDLISNDNLETLNGSRVQVPAQEITSVSVILGERLREYYFSASKLANSSWKSRHLSFALSCISEKLLDCPPFLCSGIQIHAESGLKTRPGITRICLCGTATWPQQVGDGQLICCVSTRHSLSVALSSKKIMQGGVMSIRPYRL